MEAMHDQMGLGWFWLMMEDLGSAYSPLRVYCGRLMMPCERRSMEPLAAVTARVARPASIALLGFVGRAVGQARVLGMVRHRLLPCDGHDRSADGTSTATAGGNSICAYGGTGTAVFPPTLSMRTTTGPVVFRSSLAG